MNAPKMFEGMVWELARLVGLSEDPSNWNWLWDKTGGIYLHLYSIDGTIIYRQLRTANAEQGITWKLELVST